MGRIMCSGSDGGSAYACSVTWLPCCCPLRVERGVAWVGVGVGCAAGEVVVWKFLPDDHTGQEHDLEIVHSVSNGL